MKSSRSKNSLSSYDTLVVDDRTYAYYSLNAAENALGDLSHLPCTIRIMLENLLRHEDGLQITVEEMKSITIFHALEKSVPTYLFYPYRILMDDTTGVSTLADIAALRDAVSARSKDVETVAPACLVDIVARNLQGDDEAQNDRFSLLKWGQKNVPNIRITPRRAGSMGQINLDVLTNIVQTVDGGIDEPPLLIPDTVLGIDGALPSASSLGVLGWGVDALEAESILLGKPIQIELPHILGLKFTGKPRKGSGITDIAMAVVYALKQSDCTGKIVEFYGAGLDHLTMQDRTLISGIVASTGAFCSIFPVDGATLNYLTMTGRSAHHVALVEAYAKAQGLWREGWPHDPKKDPAYSTQIELALDTVRPSLRASDTNQPFLLADAKAVFEKSHPKEPESRTPLAPVHHGDVVWADLGSYNNVPHTLEMITAALTARKALAHGLMVKPWVRALIADTHPVLTSFLKTSGLLADLENLGFKTVNHEDKKEGQQYDLNEKIESTIVRDKLVVCSVSTGPHPIGAPPHPLARSNFVASASLVVAFALSGTFLADISTHSIGFGKDGKPLTLKDILPSSAEITAAFEAAPFPALYSSFKKSLADLSGAWQREGLADTPTYPWPEKSTFIKSPPFLKDVQPTLHKFKEIIEARLLAIYGDDAPAAAMAPYGPIAAQSPAGHYLATYNVSAEDLGEYELRTGNHEVMVRGSFMGKELVNAIVPADEWMQGLSIHIPTKTTMNLFTVAERYRDENTPTIIVGGKNFGTGSKQEWAVKSMRLLGVQAVLAESYDPSFRLNLIRIGILPLQLKSGVSMSELKLTGQEFIHLAGIVDIEQPPGEVMLTIDQLAGVERFMLRCLLQTPDELNMYRNGSIWATCFRKLIS